jgi:diguanylate cyclase (GGDEF)-like protein/PAS domain S-box-containing protein
VGLACVAGYLLLEETLLTSLLTYELVVVVAAVAALVGSVRTRRPPHALTAVGLAMFAIGELTWLLFDARGATPPALVDALFLGGYIPLTASGFLLARDGESDRSSWLDTGILALAGSLLLWTVLIEPALESSTSAFDGFVTVAYPLADVALVCAVLRLVLTRHRRNRAHVLFTLGAVGTLVGDVTFSWWSIQGADDVTFSNAVWMLGYLGLGLAVIDRSATDLRHDDVDDTPARWRLLVVLGAIAAPQVVLTTTLLEQRAAGWNTRTLGLVVNAAVMVLVSLRLWNLVARAREFEARRGSNRLSALVHHSADTILITDADGVISYASPAVRSLTGRLPDACLGHTVCAWMTGPDADHLRAQLRQLAGSPRGTAVTVGGDLLHTSGRIENVEGVARNAVDDPDVGGIVVTLRNVTVRRQLEERLARQAFHDDLTGLPNRALFNDRLEHALLRSRRSDARTLGVLFIDLDDFKAVNDGLGHGAGDDLLVAMARRIESCTGPLDTVSRFGGDEFAVLVEDVADLGALTGLADHILRELDQPLHVRGSELRIRASIGVVHAVGTAVSETLLGDADLAMYSAKSAGKGRVAVFDDRMRRDAEQRLVVKTELPTALREGQFRLEYQPVVDVDDRRLTGFEALVRWEHPIRGLVSPADFIGAAEESGIIVELGGWVLEEAAAQAARWNEVSERSLSMHVNVSAVQLHDGGLVDRVRDALALTGLRPDLLVLELTESLLVEYDRIEGVLEALRTLGVGLAVDDFGTGYSSLSYLHRFPVTCVKIDRAFVAKVDELDGAALVRSIVSIAESLGLEIVAEGVETEDQLRALAGLHCRQAQGFHLGSPAPADVYGALVRAQHELSGSP